VVARFFQHVARVFQHVARVFQQNAVARPYYPANAARAAQKNFTIAWRRVKARARTKAPENRDQSY